MGVETVRSGAAGGGGGIDTLAAHVKGATGAGAGEGAGAGSAYTGLGGVGGIAGGNFS